MKPLVSVIIPVYQTEKYLAACLDSVLAQTYRRLEIILVDDGSTDGSPAICDMYAARDPRVICLHKENEGAGAARNTGLDRSSGAYICFVDSDDCLSPAFIEKLVAAVETTGAGIARGEAVGIGREVETERAGDVIVVSRGKDLVFQAIRESRACTIWATLYSRESLKGIRFNEDKGYEDLFFHAQVFGRAEAVALVPDARYGYRRNPDGLSHKAVTMRALDALAVREERLGYLKKALPAFVTDAALELMAEALQIRVRMKRSEATPKLREALAKWERRYPYSARAALRCHLRPQTKLILVLAKISRTGTVRLLKLRRRLMERRGLI